MPHDPTPVVTFLPEIPARRELHARNADEPASAPAPWLLLAILTPCQN